MGTNLLLLQVLPWSLEEYPAPSSSYMFTYIRQYLYIIIDMMQEFYLLLSSKGPCQQDKGATTGRRASLAKSPAMTVREHRTGTKAPGGVTETGSQGTN